MTHHEKCLPGREKLVLTKQRKLAGIYLGHGTDSTEYHGSEMS